MLKFELMKSVDKIIVYACLVGTVFLLAVGSDFAHAVTIFLLAGFIPGTDIAISATDMLAAIATIFTIIVFSPMYLPFIKKFIKKYSQQPVLDIKKYNHKKAKLRRIRA